MDNINVSMCNCKKFIAIDNDICECGHDYIAHLHVVIGDCASEVS